MSNEINLRVTIVGDHHPFKGKNGVLIQAYKSREGNPTMGRVRLDEGDCVVFVEPHEIKLLGPPAAPPQPPQPDAAAERSHHDEICELLGTIRQLDAYCQRLQSEVDASRKEIARLRSAAENRRRNTPPTP